MDQSTGREAAEAGRFYDALRSSGLSAAALAHGAASISQECLLLLQRCTQLLPGGRVAFYDHVLRQPLAADRRQRFCAVWRFADLERPASYLQAIEAAGLEPQWHEETSAYVTRFYTGVLEGYLAERVRFEAARGPERYRQGLERLEMSPRLAATGVLGEFGSIAVRPAR